MGFPSLRSGSPSNRVTSSPTAVISGTAIASITEADVVTGGKTIIITLSGQTWVPAGAFNAERQAIINGLDSGQAEAAGWDAVVKATQGVGGVVRTSDQIVTITLDAFATYDITATETITVTVPASAVSGSSVVGSPTFTVATAGGAAALIGGRLTKSVLLRRLVA